MEPAVLPWGMTRGTADQCREKSPSVRYCQVLIVEDLPAPHPPTSSTTSGVVRMGSVRGRGFLISRMTMSARLPGSQKGMGSCMALAELDMVREGEFEGGSGAAMGAACGTEEKGYGIGRAGQGHAPPGKRLWGLSVRHEG